MLPLLAFTSLPGGHHAKPCAVLQPDDIRLIAIPFGGNLPAGSDFDGRRVLLDRVCKVGSFQHPGSKRS